MCGIIARIGQREQSVNIVSKLKALEYRGYDSYGVLSIDDDYTAQLVKQVGTIQEDDISKSHNSVIQLAHTRWATNGEVTQENAHPHYSQNKQFYVITNGIIENITQIIEEELQYYSLYSQTDTEIIVALAQKFKDKDKSLSLVELSKIINSKLRGDFSYVLVSGFEMVVYKNSNPIIIGKALDSENIVEQYYICSDITTIQKYCSNFYILEDEELWNFTYNGDENISNNEKVLVRIHNHNNTFEEESIIWKNYNDENTNLNSSNNSVLSQLRNYEYANNYFIENSNSEYDMLKEIYEQVNVTKLITQYNLEMFKSIVQKLQSTTKPIFLLAAGTSYHAALMMHNILLKYNILTTPIIASESGEYIDLMRNSIVVVFSQSGETADCIHTLRQIKQLKNELELISIVNTQYSTLDRMAKYSIYLNCGEEKAVASTKAFMHQWCSIICIEEFLKNVDVEEERIFATIFKISNHIKNFITRNIDNINHQSTLIKNNEHIFCIGKGIFYPLALECALKLKEITYSNVSGFAAGELKHGSLALIENNTPVIVLGENSLTSAYECESRGAKLLFSHQFTTPAQKKGEDKSCEVFEEYKESIESILYLQLLSYFTAIQKSNNPDRPRNLAKSVTVR